MSVSLGPKDIRVKVKEGSELEREGVGWGEGYLKFRL